jgi:hypothetical protein
LPPSTGRRARSAAPSRSTVPSRRSDFGSEQASTPGRSSALARSSPGSPSTSAPGSRPRPGLTRCGSRAPCTTSWRAAGLRSKTGGPPPQRRARRLAPVLGRRLTAVASIAAHHAPWNARRCCPGEAGNLRMVKARGVAPTLKRSAGVDGPSWLPERVSGGGRVNRFRCSGGTYTKRWVLTGRMAASRRSVFDGRP